MQSKPQPGVGDPIATAIAAIVDAGALAGAATLVWRNGKVTQTSAVGWHDVEAGLPMQRDSLFRIASLTKPITSTAALMLVEAGVCVGGSHCSVGAGARGDAGLAFAERLAR